MNINDEIHRLERAIAQLASTEAKLKAQRMELTVLRDERRRQRQMLVDHVEQLLDQPDEYDVAEATEMHYGDGTTAAEAYLQHIHDIGQTLFDDVPRAFDIEEGADL